MKAFLKKIDNRFLPPILITVILLTGHFTFGILEAYEKTLVAILAAIGAEMLLGKLTYGKWPHPASAYITGISVGILIRSPFIWPYFFASVISILTKYVLRLDNRHLWNPSNFGIEALLFLAPQTVALLSVQWGNNLWPMAIIWTLGFVIVWRVGKLHVSAAYVAAFVVFAFVRSAITGTPWPATLAPITGPMYQLFIFFMITDPKTTVRPKWAQALVAFLVAAVEAVLRLMEFVHAPYYALFLVGPTANLIEIARARRERHRAIVAAGAV
jgi:Na+-translocating ferredoxin:NAD+ oxidoreductase RnfD subunit